VKKLVNAYEYPKLFVNRGQPQLSDKPALSQTSQPVEDRLPETIKEIDSTLQLKL
jgi:hypothetical protein